MSYFITDKRKESGAAHQKNYFYMFHTLALWLFGEGLVMVTSIVVFGGGGFLGSSIVKAALSKGWKVTSVSRRGRPETQGPKLDNDNDVEEAWHDRVEWIAGDAFDSSTYRSALAGADHVAHTIGVLDYRGVLTESRPSRVLDKLGLTIRDALFSPSQSHSQHKDDELAVYDKLNRDALISVAKEATRHENIKSFVYISAAAGFPGVPDRYITTKREAEQYLTQIPNKPFRSILFRPGFMFSDDRGFTKPLARLLGLSYAANSSLNNKIPFIGAAGVKPLAVERVGSAVIEACDGPQVEGVVDIHQIEALADIRWRAEMIV